MDNPPAKDPKDRRVLSVSATNTYTLMTEHNVYSCPDNYQPHDPTVKFFAPRNHEGKILSVYCIVARVVTDPTNPIFPPSLNPEYAQSITAYISVVKRLNGMLDGGGKYRFYILADLENTTLQNTPKLDPPGPAHVYLSLKELLSGSSVVHAIQ